MEHSLFNFEQLPLKYVHIQTKTKPNVKVIHINKLHDSEVIQDNINSWMNYDLVLRPLA